MKKKHIAIHLVLLTGISSIAYILGSLQGGRDKQPIDRKDIAITPLILSHLSADKAQEATSSANASTLGKLLTAANKVCFIGDSLTAGSENGGFPWYMPLVEAFPHLKTDKLAIGGGTSKSLLEMSRTLFPTADAYIIALGTNDVRYRDAQRGACTQEEYIDNLSSIVALARELNDAARFVFIAPWCSIPEDPIPPIPREQKEQLMSEYAEALRLYCAREGFLYINPNALLSTLIRHPLLRKHYMSDHIHPTHPYGCYLYSAAVWEAARLPYE